MLLYQKVLTITHTQNTINKIRLQISLQHIDQRSFVTEDRSNRYSSNRKHIILHKNLTTENYFGYIISYPRTDISLRSTVLIHIVAICEIIERLL